MSKKLAVLVIHGMGSQPLSFAEEMIVEINSRIANAAKNPDDITWKTVFWADIVEPKETAYLRNARRNHDLDYLRLRQFVVSALGDATAYQKVGGQESSTYQTIHSRIQNTIKELYDNDLRKNACPLIIIAHSLGGHIISNYIWDQQRSTANGNSVQRSSFERMEHVAGIVTFGCNIPLFTFAYDQVIPISFPGSALNPSEKSKARWHNYYDPDDILGYPLKAINDEYAGVVDEDIPINVGGFFSSWNPASHGMYWTDNNFTKPTANFLSSFL